jgi:hypothetical protein
MGALGPVGLTAWVGLFAVGEASGRDGAGQRGGGRHGQHGGATGRRRGAGWWAWRAAHKAQVLREWARMRWWIIAPSERIWAPRWMLPRPGKFDVYFDNIGGPTLDAVLPRMREKGRIPLCGMIAQYNDADHPYGVQNLWQMVVAWLTMRGFLTYDHADRLGEAQAMLDGCTRRGNFVRWKMCITALTTCQKPSSP